MINLLLWLIWTKLFVSNFDETKTGTFPFKAGDRLFEQTPVCCKYTATCFKPGDIYSEGTISCFFQNFGLQNEYGRRVLFKTGANYVVTSKVYILEEICSEDWFFDKKKDLNKHFSQNFYLFV